MPYRVKRGTNACRSAQSITRLGRRTNSAFEEKPTGKRPQSHVDAGQLPPPGAVEQIDIRGPHDLYPGDVDELTVKDVMGQRDVPLASNR